MKNSNRLDKQAAFEKAYKIFSYAAVFLFAFLFTFPLYWILTGAFKTKADILATEPVWWPNEWVTINFENLMSKRSAPLFDFTIPALKINAFA